MTHDVVVEHSHTVFTDRTESQFRLIRHAELADHQHVEGGAERLGDLERHRHAAARQTQNDDVLTPQALETPDQLAPRVCPIIKRIVTSTNALSGALAGCFENVPDAGAPIR